MGLSKSTARAGRSRPTSPSGCRRAICAVPTLQFTVHPLTRTQWWPNNRIAHAEVRIGDSVVMLGEARDGHKPRSCMLYLYVSDADATWQRAVAAGATAGQAPQNQFYGDRSGSVIDPCGNEWWIATRIEDVPPDELRRRATAMMQNAAQ
jgi:PhnB protein